LFLKEGASKLTHAFLPFQPAYFLHPEQEAQQSAEEQHDVFAAFTAPAKPSAITAINRNALKFFMIFSFENRIGFCQPTAMPSARNRSSTFGDF
jgi:hypothetical protein